MKLWGGRFAGRPDPHFEAFSESFSVDHRLINHDLRVNRAYVKRLGEAGVLTKAEVRKLTRGLTALERYVSRKPSWARGQSSEDVHTWVEGRLQQEVGETARKLRTGRSRNDLVATDLRLFVKDSVRDLQHAAARLLAALLEQARRQAQVIMPGFTHLQPAQPILFSHYLLAYFEMLLRDISRLDDCHKRADELPMGAGALAGTSFPIDRKRLARELGFARVARNSVDATSDRDFVCELVFTCVLVMVHLSRLAEDFIIFSTPAFGFLELADAYSTGSSLMPQKKNPDALELIRGRAGRVVGKLTALVALLKGLPLAYNRDLQEDKLALFDAVDTTRDALEVAARAVSTLRVDPERMRAAAQQGFMTATDLADELVRRGLPFAEAHAQVGKLVSYCLTRGNTFADIPAVEARKIIPSWDSKLAATAASLELAVRRKNSVGGTAPFQVARQLRWSTRALVRLRRQLSRAR